MDSQTSTTEMPFAIPQDELFHFLLRHIPDRIYFKDSESRFVWVSDSMSKFFGGRGPSELYGKTDFDFFTEEHAQQAFDDEQAVMRSGEPVVNKVEKETLPDGRICWAMTTKIPLRDSNGNVVGTCGISGDFTAQKALEDSLEKTNAELESKKAELEKALIELKAAQKDLFEAERMRAQARFVVGIAHEIRNPLNNLNMAAEFLKSQKDIPPTVVEMMQNSIQQADAVISALMDATSSTGLRLEPMDIKEVLEKTVSSVRREGDGNVQIDVDVEESLPLIAGDDDRLGQCFRGIIRNSLDAMTDGGKVTVTVRRLRLEEENVKRSVGSRAANWLQIGEEAAEVKIADTGPGIPPDLLENLFDAFYTTKPTGKGTGLGLAVCRRIVELHHGAIRVENAPEGGAVVTILLPLAKKETE